MAKTASTLDRLQAAKAARQADPQRCEPRKATSGSALEIRVAQDTALFRLDSSQPFCDVRLLENQEAEALLLEVAIASVAGTPWSDDVPPYPFELGVIKDAANAKKVCRTRVKELANGLPARGVFFGAADEDEVADILKELEGLKDAEVLLSDSQPEAVQAQLKAIELLALDSMEAAVVRLGGHIAPIRARTDPLRFIDALCKSHFTDASSAIARQCRKVLLLRRGAVCEKVAAAVLESEKDGECYSRKERNNGYAKAYRERKGTRVEALESNVEALSKENALLRAALRLEPKEEAPSTPAHSKKKSRTSKGTFERSKEGPLTPDEIRARNRGYARDYRERKRLKLEALESKKAELKADNRSLRAALPLSVSCTIPRASLRRPPAPAPAPANSFLHMSAPKRKRAPAKEAARPVPACVASLLDAIHGLEKRCGDDTEGFERMVAWMEKHVRATRND